MTKTHDSIRAALDADDAAFMTSLDEEPGLFAQMGSAFHGRLKYWTAFAFIQSLVLFGAAIYCFWQMLDADTVRDAVLWATGVWSTLLAVGLFKIWFWMRMNHLAVLREIKRLEFRVIRQEAV